MIIRAEGFGHFTSRADWSAKGHRSGATASFSPTGGRGNRGCLSTGATGDTWLILPASKQTVIHHFAFNTSSLQNATLFAFADSANSHIMCNAQSDGSFKVYRGSSLAADPGGAAISLNGATLLGTSNPALLRTATSHQMQVLCTISSTVGEVTVKLDGVQVFTFSGNTQNSSGSSSVITQICMGDNLGTSTVIYSDVVVCDTLGGVHDTYLGDVAVYEDVNPIDGDELDWTRSSGAGTWSSHVDDNPQDGDTTYIVSSVNGDRNCFSFPTVTSAIGTPLAIKSTVCVTKEDPAFGAVKLYSRSTDDVDHDGSTQTVTEDYIFVERIYDTDELDSAAWDIARVNDTQLGTVNVS